MTDKPKRRVPQVDLDLLPPEVADHYRGDDKMPPWELLMVAAGWFQRGLEAGKAEADAQVERERARFDAEMAALAWVSQAPRPARPEPPAQAITTAQNSTQAPAWKPAPPNFHPDHGQKVDPNAPTQAGESVGDALADYVAPDAPRPHEGAPPAQAPPPDGDVEPEFLPIGHYSSDVVAPVVRQAMAMAKNPQMGAKVARDLLADAEKRCKDVPTSMFTQIDARLKSLNERNGEDWSGEWADLGAD